MERYGRDKGLVVELQNPRRESPNSLLNIFYMEKKDRYAYQIYDFERKNGGSCRIRTCDQLVKSQLLYQLS